MAENDSGSGPAEKPVESFEACLDELEQVVRQLEAGDLPLERVEMLIRKEGKIVPEPFHPANSGKT